MGLIPALVSPALVTLATIAPAASAAERRDDFGRWQHDARSCERNLAGQEQAPCTGLRFEQNRQGLLNIRFLGPGRGEQAGREETTNLVSFVGVVREGGDSLSCHQGHCQLKGPLRTEISSVSETSYDSRGLAITLPNAWPAEGSCDIQRNAVICRATAPSGERWSATAAF